MKKNFVFLLWLLFFLQCEVKSKTYVIVLDPGHGGRSVYPHTIYGDKFDKLSNRHSESFRSGAAEKGVHEQDEVYSISRVTEKTLNLLKTPAGRLQFQAILEKYYPGEQLKTTNFEIHQSRPDGYYNNYRQVQEDINAPYRLYDYEDIRSGEMKPGVISRIHQFKPHLVVAMHLTSEGSAPAGSLNSVITPGFDTYKTALEYVKASPKDRIKIKQAFDQGSYRLWFDNGDGRNLFESFLTDAWIYFNGYWSTVDGLNVNPKRYRGYRHNMIQWAYSDHQGWEEIAKQHPVDSPYALELRNFKLSGKFWQREQNNYERFRREGGPEGRGGDNFFASEELLRFVRKGLYVNKTASASQLPVILQPYISTWSLPTYVNAITAYLELGYLDNPNDFKRLTTATQVYGESIAIGIYSLFYGINKKVKEKLNDFPRSQALNLDKYNDYFSAARID